MFLLSIKGKFVILVTIAGLIIALFFLYFFNFGLFEVSAQSETETVGISITILGEDIPPPGGGPVPHIPPAEPGDVILEGKAYPRAIVTILVDGAIKATFQVGNDALFSRKIPNILGGIHTFSVYAEDTERRLSPTISVSVNILPNSETKITGLFIPPTIEAPSNVKQNQPAVMRGQGFPGSVIFLFVEPGNIVEDTIVNLAGIWQYLFDTRNLEDGDYTVRAKAITESGEQSEFSQILTFKISEFICGVADFNCDGRVDLQDLSIMMFWWDREDTVTDINRDGITNIIDFSIFLFHWTG